MVPSAAEILEQAGRRYAQCVSYRDKGEVLTEFITGDWPHQRRSQRISFSTLFVRPQLFRFEFAQTGPGSEWIRGAVWATGGTVYSWRTEEKGIKISSSIPDALSGSISMAKSAVPFSWLVIPNTFEQFRFSGSEGPVLDGTEVIEGVECFRISRPIPRRRTIDVWVDAATSLIRKVKMQTYQDQSLTKRINQRILSEPRLSNEQRADLLVGNDFRTEQITTCVAHTDIPIPPEAFAFTPPE